MEKMNIWPRQGKLKKMLIILGIVAVTALGMVLLEEQTHIKLSNKAIFPVVLTCVAIWFHQPKENKEQPPA